MPIIKRTITTELPVDRVFPYLADFSNAEEWDPGTRSSIPLEDGEPAVGSAYDLVVTFGSRTLPMTYRITELETNKRLELVGDGSTTRAVDTMTFCPTADNGTVVTYQADIRLKGMLRFAEPFLGKKFDELGNEAESGLRSAFDRLASGAS